MSKKSRAKIYTASCKKSASHLTQHEVLGYSITFDKWERGILRGISTKKTSHCFVVETEEDTLSFAEIKEIPSSLRLEGICHVCQQYH